MGQDTTLNYKNEFSTHATLFVSSTFQDMHKQRDMLKNKVLPLLNKEANKYGYSVSICDLRWGIDTLGLDEDIAAQKVLRVCLNEIDASSPPVIVFLGSRYGWIPGADLVQEVCEEKGLILDSYDISVTNLEIEYSRFKYNNYLFYLFDDGEKEGALQEKQLIALKEKIVQEYPEDVKEGITPSDAAFSEVLLQDILKKLQNSWNKRLSPEEVERQKHWNYFHEKMTSFSARKKDLDNVYSTIETNGSRLIIKGDHGIGKSTLIGKLVYRLSENGYRVLPISCGLTEHSSTCINILSDILTFLGIAPGKENLSINSLLKLYKSAINNIPTNEKYVIVLDGINQLLDEDKDVIISLLQMASRCSYVVSATPNVETKDLSFYTLMPLQDEDRLQVVSSLLKENHKELPQKIIDKIVKKEQSDNPLYINILIQRLLLQGSDDYRAIKALGDTDDAREKHLSDIINSVPDSLHELINNYFEIVDHNIHAGLIKKIATYIALSRYGLRASDLELLLGDEWNDLDFYTLLYYSSDLFLMRLDGRIDFTHSSIRTAILKANENGQGYEAIFNMFQTLPDNDPIKLREYVFHMIKADKKSAFIKLLNENFKDKEIMKHAVANTYYVCLLDNGDWIAKTIKGFGQRVGSDSSFYDFLLYHLVPYFRLTVTDTKIKIHILNTIEETLRDADPDNSNLVRFRKMYTEQANAAMNLEEFAVAARYGKAYFDATMRLNLLRPMSQEDLFFVYYNTLVCLKGAVSNSNTEVKKWFFDIAEEGIAKGIFDSGDDINKGQYLGCMGEAYGRCEEYKKKLEVYLNDLELRQKGFDKVPSEYNKLALSGGFYNVGTGYASLDEYDRARDYLKESIDLQESVSMESFSDREKIDYYQSSSNTYYNYVLALINSASKNCGTKYYESVLSYKEAQIEQDINWYLLTGRKECESLISEYDEWVNIIMSCAKNLAAQLVSRQISFKEHIRESFSIHQSEHYPDGSIKYDGNYINGKRNGKGTFYFENGDRYEGQWLNGIRNGQGIYYFANGNRYEGEWVNGHFDQGTYYYEDGVRMIEYYAGKKKKYEGQCLNGKRHGQGTLYYVGGNRYEGEFKEGKRDGQGTFFFTNGDRYVGGWCKDDMNGQGTLYYANGDRYEGKWIKGNLVDGTYYNADGDKL